MIHLSKKNNYLVEKEYFEEKIYDHAQETCRRQKRIHLALQSTMPNL